MRKEERLVVRNRGNMGKGILSWIDEMGHRLLKVLRPGVDGAQCVTIEMLKMERRR